MNQQVLTLRLADYLGGRTDPWGSENGQRVHDLLVTDIDREPQAIIRISLADVERTDASFARASIVELARRYRGRRGICVVDIPTEDILENLDAAANHRGQNVIAWTKKGPRLLGPPLREDTWGLLKFVLQHNDVGTAEVAKVMKKQVTNVSTRLKRLCDDGLVLRREITAPSGGVEYRYLAIH